MNEPFITKGMGLQPCFDNTYASIFSMGTTKLPFDYVEATPFINIGPNNFS
jgi:hypothetical protein